LRADEIVFDDDYLSKRYLHYLDVGAVSFSEAIGEMTRAESYPLVFNCFLGKDRTGVLAALVLGCLGVRRDLIIEDYALTAERVPHLLVKMRGDPTSKRAVDRINPVLFEAKAQSMSDFLDGLDERFGGTGEWAKSIGITARQIGDLRDILLD
jgi:protein tyrosine/serine phosphatase